MKDAHHTITLTWFCRKARIAGFVWSLALLRILSQPSPALAQWTGGPSGPLYYNSGPVGIGTSNALGQLHVNGLSGPASSAWNIYSVARFSDGGHDSNTALLFDTGATGTTGLRGFYINKNSQDFHITRFDSAGSAGPTDDMMILSNGNVGIGTSNPQAPLHVSGLSGPASSGWNIYSMARFSDAGHDSNSALLFDTGATGVTGLRGFYISKNSQDFHISRFDSAGAAAPANDFTILSNGNVGIGTLNPQYLLSVSGTMEAKEVLVTSTGWSDYVFQPGYRIRPLSEVSAYIRANHHLPDIPSEAEVKEKGISVGEMQAKLLAKVEELTLQMIEQDKQNQELRARVAQLEAGTKGTTAGQ